MNNDETNILQRLRRSHIRKYNESLFQDVIDEIEGLREQNRLLKAHIENVRSTS